MTEPRRPPPPKSYVPLDLSTGPPKLPPRPPPGDAGPPPNYTPPPPPMSDEEQDDNDPVGVVTTSTPKPRPPPPSPYQPKTQAPTASQAPLRAPPSRPIRPPTANTPSPDTHSLQSTPPRPRPRAATMSNPQPPSRPKTVKKSRPEITVVSAQPISGEVILSPTIVSPTQSHISPTTQSPRIPSRKAPTRPPPSSKKQTPPSSPSLPQSANEINKEVMKDAVDGVPVAPPRRQKVLDGQSQEKKKPPLRKSHTLPPQSREKSPPQRPSGDHKPAPPKPSPYRGTRPPAPRRVKPPIQASSTKSGSVEVKPVISSGRESPDDQQGSGSIRIISARKPKQRPPQREVIAEEQKKTDMESQKQLSTESERVTETSKTVPPQAKRRTKIETTETTERTNNDQTLHPQPKERTKLPENNLDMRRSQSPPPKPRRSISREKISSDTPAPQPRPRAESAASQPHFHKPKPPPTQSPSLQTRDASPPELMRPRSGSAVVPKKPPPPLRPITKQTPSPEKPTITVEPAPEVERRSQSEENIDATEQNITESTSHAELPVTDTKDEVIHDKVDVIQPQRRPGKPPPPRQPTHAERKPSEQDKDNDSSQSTEADPRNEKEVQPVMDSVPPALKKPPPPRQFVKESPQIISDTASTEKSVKQQQKRPEKPPPPRQVRKTVMAGDSDKKKKMTKPGKPPPPPRQPLTTQLSVGEEDRVKLPSPATQRRHTLSEQKIDKEEDKVHRKRRSPMMIRPGYEVEHGDIEKRSSLPKSNKVVAMGTSLSPKPARPPSRPMTQPSKKKQTETQTETQTEPQTEPQTATQTETQTEPQTESQTETQTEPQTESQTETQTEPQTESQNETQTEPQTGPQTETQTEPLPVLPAENTNTIENSFAAALDSDHEDDEMKAKQTEVSDREETVQEVKITDDGDEEEKIESTNEEEKQHIESEKVVDTITVAEKTDQEITGVVLRRREAASVVTQLETHPKRARPMSMPPGRPRKQPPKPPAPSTRPQYQNKPPKPAQPPARPATHGPARPAKGPSRPTQPKAPSRTPHAVSPVDPNVPPSLPPRPTPGHLLYKYVCTEPHGIALTNHDPTDPVELPYETEDVIELIEKVDEYWFYARNADLEMCEGMVPARDIHIVKRLPGESMVSGFEEGPCAVAMFTFYGQTMDELSFKDGELIMLKTRVGKEWLRGKLVSGQEGIFPRSFVEIVEDLPADAVEEIPAPTQSQSTVEIHGPHCVALYDFKAASSDELSLSVGDMVELLARVGSDWLRGRLRGQEGIFPSEFVEIKQDLSPANNDGLSKTLFDFEGQEGELSFKAGVNVKVLSRVNEEWVEGELDGRRGIFPASFVDHLPVDLPQQTATTESTQSLIKQEVMGKCEAMFDYTPENAGELSFKAGDVILTLEWVNEEWMSGSLGEQEGMFPISFVKILKELPKPTHSKEPSKVMTHLTKVDDSLLPRAEALNDFTATDSNHLSFKTGDILNLLEKIGGKGDWYSGENTRTGSFGDFPAKCVKVIEPLP